MNTETKRKQFLEMYKMLCEEFNMCIEAWSSESGMDIGVGIGTITTENELNDHIKELKDNA